MSRVMGLDIGIKTIGIALSDQMGWIAQPLLTIRRTSWQEDLVQLIDVSEKYQIHTIVVGLPKNMDGTIGKQAEYVCRVAERIQTALPALAVEFVDERLTTVMAQKALIAGNVKKKRRKEIIDQQAAVLILQTFLERGRARKKPEA